MLRHKHSLRFRFVDSAGHVFVPLLQTGKAVHAMTAKSIVRDVKGHIM